MTHGLLRATVSLLVAVPALACSSSSGSSGTLLPDGGIASNGGGSNGDAAQVCFDKINMYRATLGLPPYERWNAAESCADNQAQSDSASGKAHGAFGMCGELAQNECPGWGGPPASMIPKCLEAMWGEGPGGGHYENMRSSKYTKAACGFYTKPDGSVWAVQDFR